MKWDGKEDEFELANGRRFYANCGLLAVFDDDQGDDAGGLAYGYDSTVGAKADFTAEERAEIAEHMIARWKKWAAL